MWALSRLGLLGRLASLCSTSLFVCCVAPASNPTQIETRLRLKGTKLGGFMYDDTNELLKTLGAAAISIALVVLLLGFVLSFRG